MILHYDHGFSTNLIEGLQRIGHRTEIMGEDGNFFAATAIAREGDQLSAVYDKRRLGSFSIF